MLKRYKNALFEAVQATGLDITDFSGGERATPRGPAFVIKYTPGNIAFTVHNPPEDPHVFYYTAEDYTGFAQSGVKPSYYPISGYFDFDQLRYEFEAWLGAQVRTAIDEGLLPDLWTDVRAAALMQKETGTEHFTDDERRQLKLALETFRVRLVETFHPTEEQMKVVSQRLDYLVAAVDRLNKFDWKSVALSTLIGIATTLSLDTEKGRQLYGLFQQGLSSLLHLIR
jgi:hypothetical protein